MLFLVLIPEMVLFNIIINDFEVSTLYILCILVAGNV